MTDLWPPPNAHEQELKPQPQVEAVMAKSAEPVEAPLQTSINPYLDNMNRRNFLKVAAVSAVVLVVANNGSDMGVGKLFGGSSENTGIGEAGNVPSTTIPSESTFPPVTLAQAERSVAPTSTVAPVETTPATVPASSTTEVPTTTAAPVETAPLSPEFKVDYMYAPGEVIGSLTINTPGVEEPKLSVDIVYTDNPSAPQIPLPPNPGETEPDYYTHYLADGSVDKKIAGLAGDSTFPGEKAVKDDLGVVPDDGRHKFIETQIFGHRTSHGAPFLALGEVHAGDVIKFAYSADPVNPNAVNNPVVGKIFHYGVIEEPVTVPNDSNINLFLRNPAPGVDNVMLLYACTPPKKTTHRIGVVAQLLSE